VAYLTTFIFIGFLLWPAVVIFDVILCIVAGVKANEGVSYRYPLTIRFIS
jgi:hypothetical protein